VYFANELGHFCFNLLPSFQVLDDCVQVSAPALDAKQWSFGQSCELSRGIFSKVFKDELIRLSALFATM
jgi:hypothetical protein